MYTNPFNDKNASLCKVSEDLISRVPRFTLRVLISVVNSRTCPCNEPSVSCLMSRSSFTIFCERKCDGSLERRGFWTFGTRDLHDSIVFTSSFVPSGLPTLQVIVKLSPNVSSSQNGKMLRNTMSCGRVNATVVRYDVLSVIHQG